MRLPAGRVVLALALAVWASVPAPMWCLPELEGGIATCSASAPSCDAVCAAPGEADPACGASCGTAREAESARPCPWIPRTDDGRMWCLVAPTPVLGARGDDAPPPDPTLAPESVSEPPAPPAAARAWSSPRAHAPPWAPRHGPPSPRAPPAVA